MKQQTQYRLNKISKNLDYFFDNASDEDIIYGKEWYKKANDICNQIASEYGTTTFVASQVISALSPRNKWEQNILDAFKVFDAIRAGLSADDIKVCTFHSNKYKAFAIANGTLEITPDSRKTYAFCRNIAHLDENYVTVDIWHLRACFNKVIKIDSASIGKKAYQQIQDITLQKAKALGLTGFEYQAIIWGSIRNN